MRDGDNKGVGILSFYRHCIQLTKRTALCRVHVCLRTHLEVEVLIGPVAPAEYLVDAEAARGFALLVEDVYAELVHPQDGILGDRAACDVNANVREREGHVDSTTSWTMC